MSQPDLQTHEAKFHLHYSDVDLYWALTDLLLDHADGYAETSAEFDGEEWDIRLNYSDSGIAPRPSDSLSRETVYEYDLTAVGRSERKFSVNFSPRWGELRTPDGDAVDTPWNYMDREGVDGHVQGSNVALDDYPGLIARALQEIALDVGYDLNQSLDPFGGRIYEVERYLRLNYDQSLKLVGETGIMQRLMMLLAEAKGTQAELSIDNEGRVGKFSALQLYSADVAEVFPRHRAAWGRQLKCYLPRNPESFEPDDTLYHPKVGALYRTSLSRETVDWDDRDDILRELDETVLNALAWSDIPIDVGLGGGEGGGTTIFVADDHFSVEPRLNHVPISPDPTPELEAQQDSILAWALSSTTDSDRDVLEALTDGGQHKDELQQRTGWSESTLYRALDRLEGAVESQQGHFRYASRRFKQEVSGLIEQLEDVRGSVVEKIERLTDYEIRSRASSSFERWLAEYGAEFVDAARSGEGQPVIRIDTVLSRIKSNDHPMLSDVVAEMVQAWQNDMREYEMIRDAIIEAPVAWQDEPYRAPVTVAL